LKLNIANKIDEINDETRELNKAVGDHVDDNEDREDDGEEDEDDEDDDDDGGVDDQDGVEDEDDLRFHLKKEDEGESDRNNKLSSANEEKVETQENIENSTPKEKLINETDILKMYVITSNFRSISNLMQNEVLASEITENTERLRCILSSSINETQCGGLGVIEQIEQRWGALWEAWNNLRYKSIDELHKDDNNKPISSIAIEKENNEKEISDKKKIGYDLISGIAARLDAAASASSRNILSSLGASMTMSMAMGIDPISARKHMMEMGFPKEWCEVALRRCRYNVEMAINLCFEHGGEMDQLVAEDNAIMTSRAARGSRRFGNEFEPDSSDAVSSSGSSTSGAGAGAGAGADPRSSIFGAGGIGRGLPRPSSRSTSASTMDSNSLLKQLLEMGFPQNWCSKALDVNNNNVDAALTWMLSHGEDLGPDDDIDKDGESYADADGEEDAGDAGESECHTKDKSEHDEIIPSGPNPLCCKSYLCDAFMPLIFFENY
jgi:hypothetical protein